MNHHDKHNRPLLPHVRAAAIVDREMRNADPIGWFDEWLRLYREVLPEIVDAEVHGKEVRHDDGLIELSRIP